MSNGKSQSGIFIVFGVLALAAIAMILLRRQAPLPAISLPKDEAAHLSDSVAIRVYLDGSGSIKHFLQADATGDSHNYLRELLDKCETTLRNAPGESSLNGSGHAGGWKDKTVSFWRFGNGNLKKISDGGGLQAMSRDLSQFNESKTLIETPIADSPPQGDNPKPEVKVIITDLYQTGGLLERPADALAAKYLQGDTAAVGILAVRNPFSGGVEDLPGMAPGQTLPDAADSMPFYVIVAGPAADVRHTLTVLENGTGLNEALAKHRAAEFYFSRAPSGQPHGLPVIVGDRQTQYSSLAADPHSRDVARVKLSQGALQFTWKDTARPADEVPVGGSDALVGKVSSVDRHGTPHEDADAALAVTACVPPAPLCARVDRGRLTKGVTYAVELDRMESTPADTLSPESPFMKPWNIEQPEAERIARGGKSFPMKAGLTPDLSKFLMALQGQMFHAPVRLATYYLYVQAN